VNNWVNGRAEPQGRNLECIAEYFGVSVEKLTPMLRKPPPRVDRNVRVLPGGRAGRRMTTEQVLAIKIRGRAPADTQRWTAAEEEDRVVYVSPDLLPGLRAHDLIAVEVSGDCLVARRIMSGDIVICERVTDAAAVPQGCVVLVRVEDDIALKVWYWAGRNRAELRDGDDNIITALDADDDFEVMGIARARIGPVA
jgi:hypothetical protein